MDKVRILFLPPVDADSVNAQSLNVREIALRLDPERFQITVLYEREADSRLKDRAAIRIKKLPEGGKTLRILSEMTSGYDMIGYMDYSPASYAFLRLPRFLRRGAKSIFHAEAPAAQMVNPSRTLRVLYRGIFPRCDFYTGISEFVAEDVYKSLGKQVSHVLPVGVDTNLFIPPPARTNADPVVLFAGTLIPRKGPEIILNAAAQFPNAKFRIVGSAREGFDKVLQQKIAQSDLRNVKLDGRKTQCELLEIMRNSDIFLLPSRLEGMPKVSLEAAATGLPCVVFRDYKTPSVIDGVTGFQVGTNEEMMQALQKLIGDRSLRERMGKAAREHVSTFRWDVVSEQWQNAYLEIAAARAS